MADIEVWKQKLGIRSVAVFAAADELPPEIELCGFYGERDAFEALAAALTEAKNHGSVGIVEDLRKARLQLERIKQRINTAEASLGGPVVPCATARAKYRAHRRKVLRFQIEEEKTRMHLFSGTVKRGQTNKFHLDGKEKAANRRKLSACAKRLQYSYLKSSSKTPPFPATLTMPPKFSVQ